MRIDRIELDGSHEAAASPREFLYDAMSMKITAQILATAIAASGGTAVTLTGPFQAARDTEDEVSSPIQIRGENGPSVSGMAAGFFAMPANHGERVLACGSSQTPDPDCARKTAEQFCLGVGYTYVGNLAMETVENRVYLTDVLCKRSAVAITW